MSHGIHTCMCNKFNRHCLRKFRIYNGNIRCNLKVRNRIFDTFFIIRDNRKCRNLSGSTRCRRNRTEMCFLSEFWKPEYLTHILKCHIRIFILNPHSLCRINRRTATHSNNPVRFKLLHNFRSTHNSFY